MAPAYGAAEMMPGAAQRKEDQPSPFGFTAFSVTLFLLRVYFFHFKIKDCPASEVEFTSLFEI